MRLIDADALLEEIRPCKKAITKCANHDYLVGYASALSGVEGQIAVAPTIDAEPVRHGRWRHTTREDSDWGGTFHRYTCSACSWSMGDNPYGWGNYCPNCGTKMDEEVQHAEKRSDP